MLILGYGGVMLPEMWRLLVSLADWRYLLRSLRGIPKVDVVCISNLRDQVDKLRYRGRRDYPQGHFAGAKFWLDGIAAQTRGIDTTTEELLTAHGRRKAKEQFVCATQWAAEQGAKVILLAAATKRLFGHNGTELKRMFPNLVFTIGDNGTVVLLLNEIQQTIEKRLHKSSRIAVLGPYGFLGEQVTKYLSAKGYTVMGVGPNVAGLKRIHASYGISTYRTLQEIEEIDAIVACTHSKTVQLDAQLANTIRRNGKRLLVLDVAEPPNLTDAEYRNCRSVVVRQDAGNAYSPRLKYVLGALSYKMFRLSRGTIFGCFAEAISLASGLKKAEKLKSIDWFEVTDANQQIIRQLFNDCAFRVPSPRCFGMPVYDFSLNMNAEIGSHVFRGPLVKTVNET
jgi:predicted CoA-binding protein